MRKNTDLTPLQKKIVEYIRRHGFISGRRAMLDFDIPTNSLTSRISELTAKGYKFHKKTCENVYTGHTYTRYSLAN